MSKIMNRVWIAITALIGVIAGFALLIYLVTALNWRSQPFIGVLFTPIVAVDGSTALGNEAWHGLANGLQRLDQIVAINDTVLYDSLLSPNYDIARQRMFDTLADLNPGDQVTVEFIRPSTMNGNRCPGAAGTLGDCQITYPVSGFPDTDWIGFFVVPFITGAATWVIGLAVLWLRPNQPGARLVSLIAFFLGIMIGGLFDLDTTHVLIPLWLVANFALAGSLATFIMVFPVKPAFLFTRPRLLFLPFALGLVAVPIVLWFYANPPSPGFEINIPPFLLVVASIITLVVSLLRHRRYAVSAIIRDQSNTILIGMGLTCVPVTIWLINIISQAIHQTTAVPFNISAATPFVLTAPFSMAYAVLQYRSVNTDRIISQAITYSIMLAALVSGYGLLVFSASLILTQDEGMLANNPLLVGFTVFLVAVLFLPLRTFLQQRIDRLYFRQRIDFQNTVETFTHEIAHLGTLDEVAAEFRQVLDRTIAPAGVFIFLRNHQSGAFLAVKDELTDVEFDGESGIVQKLEDTPVIYLEPNREWPLELRTERARLQILNALVIIGLRGSQQVNGFVCIGPPQGRDARYSHEELLFMQSLVNQMSIATERAQVVASLERRVRELDVLGQVGQAVNFAINLDDLLELLSAQTNRLIEATNFYIALRDEVTDTIYYAFFLEDDERYPEKENKPWRIGGDLLSEVVQKGQPLRVSDYAAAMSQRSAPITFEDPQLKAWMGVPLTAGAETLGIMAVASKQPGSTYGDDQFKIFSDISSLAATSIEKARLFSETNKRARQLAALNEISNELAREQQDIDKLLELITSSAVDILNAEAGSLLLTIDDGSSDLEFKIAIGTSGADLIGRRFPSGEGLVGEVAKSGRYVIVNDTSRDDRWAGEVTETDFRTTSILAVPLIDNNQLLGVLEVLNKKDRAIFVDDDANLLNTFAGQAAVAIDNARLFQMTDQQLSDRVDELETLERIDAELNRSLDINTVAEITVRWAVAQSGATAAALGIVTGDYLEIAARYGYRETDFPEGAQGNFWPRDKGIVSRVMRTRQPDIATDIRIDPDYIPGQRHCLSQITVPMMSGDEINALLILEKNVEPRFGLVDMAFVQRLAEHASIALVNAQLYVDLARANDSKSEFVSFVAHELKTPMTSIKGYTDLLLGGVTGEINERQESFLGTIKSNIERMNTLVSDLNDVTKLQTGNFHMEFAPVDFRNVIEETLRPLQRQIDDKGQTLDIQLPDDLPHIQADQNRLIQVLTNLVSNAYKYTPENGLINITGEITANRWGSNGKRAETVLHIHVKDTGIGMSEADLESLFTPYFRSENPMAREQPGTGLGLTITRGIVERHGGQIWVESELGEGTTFHFTVPMAPEPQQQPSSEQ